ncbi:MAG: tetratricopeptide repeat protein [Treponema sp.]|jgi:Ca-activated chloride channel family protein|nr:tetratricopeptide repeat protein [Treponema sp.]
MGKQQIQRGLVALSVVLQGTWFGLVCSCSIETLVSTGRNIPGMLLIMEGNFFNSRNQYPKAIAAYLQALRYTEARPYGELGLGVVYGSLDEGAAALERFSAAAEALQDLPKEAAPELVYRIHYNRGVVCFKEEDYAGAAAAFRQALETDNSRIEAKRNLELSLLALAQGRRATAVSPQKETGTESEAGASALFEYLYKKEQNQWKSREWIEAVPPTGPDY